MERYQKRALREKITKKQSRIMIIIILEMRLGGLLVLMVLGVISGAMSCPLDAVGACFRAVATVRVSRGTKILI